MPENPTHRRGNDQNRNLQPKVTCLTSDSSIATGKSEKAGCRDEFNHNLQKLSVFGNLKHNIRKHQKPKNELYQVFSDCMSIFQQMTFLSLTMSRWHFYRFLTFSSSRDSSLIKGQESFSIIFQWIHWIGFIVMCLWNKQVTMQGACRIRNWDRT